MGLGETLVESIATRLPEGGFATMEIGTRHFAFVKEGATIQVHGTGPWGITYVNRADDPRANIPLANLLDDQPDSFEHQVRFAGIDDP